MGNIRHQLAVAQVHAAQMEQQRAEKAKQDAMKEVGEILQTQENLYIDCTCAWKSAGTISMA